MIKTLELTHYELTFMLIDMKVRLVSLYENCDSPIRDFNICAQFNISLCQEIERKFKIILEEYNIITVVGSVDGNMENFLPQFDKYEPYPYENYPFWFKADRDGLQKRLDIIDHVIMELEQTPKTVITKQIKIF